MAAPPVAAEDRRRIYRRIERRNRVVAVLRILVPVLGLVIFGLAVLQVYLVGLGREFGISRLSVDRDRVTVDTPRYTGALDDGTLYQVSALSASASVMSMNLIDLVDAVVVLDRINGSTMTVKAAAAQFDTDTQQVTVAELADIADSAGTTGTMVGLFVDWPKQQISATGAVHFLYPNGTILDAVGMRYDPKDSVWTFSRATLTVPQTADGNAATAATPGTEP